MANDKKTIKIDIEGDAQSLKKSVDESGSYIEKLKEKVLSTKEVFVDGVHYIVAFGAAFSDVIKSNLYLSAEYAAQLKGIRGGLLGLLTLKNADFSDLFGKFIVHLGALGLQINEAKHFESEFANIKKVVSATDDEFLALEKTIKRLAVNELPLNLTDLNHITEAGGQLGVAASELEDFIRIVSQSAVALKIPADEAGMSIAKLSTLYKQPIKDIRILLDEIHILSNSNDSMPKDIIAVQTSLGGDARNFGLLKNETAAIASTVLSLGAGADTADRSLRSLFTGLLTGEGRSAKFNDSLEKIGFSANQLAENIRKNPKQALLEFLDQLNTFDNVSKLQLLNGMFGTGKDLGEIAKLAERVDLLRTNFELVKNEAAAAGSMAAAFAKQAETLDNKAQLAANAVGVLAVEVGNPFLAPMKKATDIFHYFTSDLANFAAENPAVTAFLRIIAVVKTLSLFLNALVAIFPLLVTTIVRFNGLLLSSPLVAFAAQIGGATLAVILLTGVVGGFNSVALSMTVAVGLIGYNSVLAFKAAGESATVFRSILIGLRTTFSALLVAFGGGWIAALIVAFTSLFVLWENTKDKIVNLGKTNATVAEFVSAMWRVATSSIVQSVNYILEKLNELTAMLFGIEKTNKKATDGIANDWNDLNESIPNRLKGIINAIKGIFDFISDYFVIHMGTAIETVKIRLQTAVELVKAAARDIQNAWHFDFNFSNSKAAMAEGEKKTDAVQEQGSGKVGQSLFRVFTTDYVDNEIDAGRADQVKKDLEEKNKAVDEAAKHALEVQKQLDDQLGKVKVDFEPKETKAELSAKNKHIKALADLQQAAIKNQQDALKDAHDYELGQLDVIFKERQLNLKKLGLSDLEEKQRGILLAKEQADAKIAIERDFILKSAKLADDAINAKIKVAQAEAARTASSPTGSLGALIAGGESRGDYNAYNRGTTSDGKPLPSTGKINLEAMTIAEIQAKQALSIVDKDRLGAVGKYQLIASTLKSAVAALKLSADTKFDAATQEKIFTQYLLDAKRPSIKEYITGNGTDKNAVQYDAAQEFASIADPKTGKSVYPNNTATVSSAQFQPALESAKNNYQQNISLGLDKKTAYVQAISTGGTAGNEVEDEQDTVTKIAALNNERVANEADKVAKLKKLGLDEKTALVEKTTSELEIAKQAAEKEKALLHERQQATYNLANDQLAAKQAEAQQQYALGVITQAELLAMEQEYAKERFAIALKLAEQKRDLTKVGTVERAQAEEAVLQLERDYAATSRGLANQQVLDRKQQFDKIFAPLTNALDQSVNGILTGQQTLSNALRNTAQSITISYIQEALKRRAVLAQNWLFEKLGYAKVGAEKMTIDKNVDIFDGLLWIGKKMRLAGQWAWDLLGFGAKETAKVGIKAGSETAQAGAVVAGETIKAGAVAVGEGVQTAAVAAGESERSSITMLGTLKTIGAKAAQAAAGAFAWVMAEVPFPLNVILAPVAAAGAFLGTMAFGSMVSSKGGEWDVPEDRLQLVHKRETILPEWAAAPLRKLVMQGQPLAGGVSNTAGRKVTDTTESVKAIASTVSSLVSSTVQSVTDKASTAGQRITDTTESVKAVASTVRSLVSSTVQSVTDKTQSAYEVANKIKFAASGAVLPSNTRQIVADLALAGKIYPLQLPDSALAMRKTSAQAATQFAKEQYLVKRDQRKSDSERVRDRSKSGGGMQIVQLDINDFFGRHGNAIVKSVGKQLRNFNTGK